MTVLGALMVLFSICGFVVFCILLVVDLVVKDLLWYHVAMPLFVVAAMWIGRELLAAFVDYKVRKNRIKARRKSGRVGR